MIPRSAGNPRAKGVRHTRNFGVVSESRTKHFHWKRERTPGPAPLLVCSGSESSHASQIQQLGGKRWEAAGRPVRFTPFPVWTSAAFQVEMLGFFVFREIFTVDVGAARFLNDPLYVYCTHLISAWSLCPTRWQNSLELRPQKMIVASDTCQMFVTLRVPADHFEVVRVEFSRGARTQESKDSFAPVATLAIFIWRCKTRVDHASLNTIPVSTS